MWLDRDFIFAGEPTNNREEQALGHSNGFDQQRRSAAQM